MSGSIADIVARLRRWLPTRWLPQNEVNPDGTVPRIHAQLTGTASLLSGVAAQTDYVRDQSRISTATDGFLDLASADYLADELPRITGELDASYRRRIAAAVLPHANTRAAVSAAITAVVGTEPRIVEPFRPADTGVLDGVWIDGACYGAIYYDVDTVTTPGRFSDPASFPYSVFIDTSPLRIALLGGFPVPCFDDGMFFDVAGSSLFDFAGSVPLGERPVIAAISRKIAAGIQVWVRFS